MERIREAVEQARKQRAENADKATPASEAHAQVPAKPQSVDSAASASGKSDSGNYEYTQTRKVTVSPIVREANRLVAAIPDHPLVDTYRMLRTRVLQEMRANNWRVMAVTSPATGSGKTLTAINLAISIGRDLSSSALLIDGDLRQPSVAEYFGFKPDHGINDFLLGGVPVSECLFHPDMDRLVVLPGREPLSESAEMLASEKVAAFMKEARARYNDRIIIVDTAPVLSVDDVLAMAPHIDCLLMVAEAGETKREDLGKALELLQGIPILGTVLNKVDKKVTEAY